MRVRARGVRRAGASFKEVAQKIGISSGTAWVWCRDITLSDDQLTVLKKRSGGGAVGRARAHARCREIGRERRERWQCEAQQFWEQHYADHLFMLGVGLYWGEGTKAKALELANADPHLARAWLAWCQRFVPERQLRFWVQAHDDVVKEEALSYWRRELGLEVTAPIGFSIARSSASKKIYKESRRLPFGTVRITMKRGAAEWIYKMTAFLNFASQFVSAESRLQPGT